MPPPRRQPAPSPVPAPIIEVNGWRIYAHPLFIAQIAALASEVEHLRTRDPIGYREKKKTKLLAAIYKMAFEVIPSDPANHTFLQGSTLGASYRHWHRGRFFDGRYRLFFRYATAERAIVLAWVNDEHTLRTYGSNADAYAVFKRMLDKGNPPDNWGELLREAKGALPRAKKLLTRRPETKR